MAARHEGANAMSHVRRVDVYATGGIQEISSERLIVMETSESTFEKAGVPDIPNPELTITVVSTAVATRQVLRGVVCTKDFNIGHI